MTSRSSPTPTPSPLDDLHALMEPSPALGPLEGAGLSETYFRLRAFLSSPAVMALADPALKAAAEVVISKLPELMEMEGKAQGAPWKATPHFIQPTDSWDLVVQDTAGGRTLALTPASAILAATARNLLHEAAQAAKGEGA